MTLEKFKQIRNFIFDIDGVLTDGSITLMSDGSQVRKMNIKDGYAIQLAIKKGYHISVISGGSSEMAKKRLQGLGVEDIHLKCNNKLEALEEIKHTYEIELERTLYMGDDMPDYLVMKEVGLATCPANAAIEIQEIAHYVSAFKGGEGCVRDVIEKVLKINSHWV